MTPAAARGSFPRFADMTDDVIGQEAGGAPGGGGESPDVRASAERGLLGHTRHGGGGDPVVVLHEWMGDHTNFDLMLPFLPEDRNIWLLADLRGYGLSKSMSGARGHSGPRRQPLRPRMAGAQIADDPTGLQPRRHDRLSENVHRLGRRPLIY